MLNPNQWTTREFSEIFQRDRKYHKDPLFPSLSLRPFNSSLVICLLSPCHLDSLPLKLQSILLFYFSHIPLSLNLLFFLNSALPCHLDINLDFGGSFQQYTPDINQNKIQSLGLLDQKKEDYFLFQRQKKEKRLIVFTKLFLFLSQLLLIKPWQVSTKRCVLTCSSEAFPIRSQTSAPSFLLLQGWKICRNRKHYYGYKECWILF